MSKPSLWSNMRLAEHLLLCDEVQEGSWPWQGCNKDSLPGENRHCHTGKYKFETWNGTMLTSYSYEIGDCPPMSP